MCYNQIVKKVITLFSILIFNLIFINPCYAIKIGLQTGVDSTAVGTSINGKIIDANTNQTICDLDAMKGYVIKPYNNFMAILYNGTYYKINSDNINYIINNIISIVEEKNKNINNNINNYIIL